MNHRRVGDQLIRELLSNSSEFEKKGKEYELLQVYFDGYPLETLRHLLLSKDDGVQRVAVYVVNELGSYGCELLDEIIPLLNYSDRDIFIDAIEVVAVCAVGANVEKYVHVVRAMNSSDVAIRRLSMFLISNATPPQLEAAKQLLSTDASGQVHCRGISWLLGISELTIEIVTEMLHDEDAVIRAYGAIAAKKLIDKYPILIEKAASSPDDDVQVFAQRTIC
jgi:hypothetical protein